jgi:hypothetical protein
MMAVPSARPKSGVAEIHDALPAVEGNGTERGRGRHRIPLAIRASHLVAAAVARAELD